MKLIKPSVKYLSPPYNDIDSVYKHIEICARTAYKSENNMTDDSAKSFVDKLIANNHLAMLEHGTLYFTKSFREEEFIKKYKCNPYSIVSQGNGFYYITTNMRVIVENNWISDLKEPSVCTIRHLQRYTFRIICDRATAQQITRHRAFSFVMESQRYCNYSKGKFGNEITYIIPHWLDIEEGRYTSHPIEKDSDLIPINSVNSYAGQEFLSSLENCEKSYFNIQRHKSPQDARGVLPNATKTELIVTGYLDDWLHFFDLRLFDKTGVAHPDIKIISDKLYRFFNNKDN